MLMPRYFFNVHNGDPSIDDMGEELPDDEMAWRTATVFTADMLKDIEGKFRPGQEWSLEVTDEELKPLYFISIGSRKMS